MSADNTTLDSNPTLISSNTPKVALKNITKAELQEYLEDGKAEDIVIIDLEGKSDVADFMAIASGTSRRQLSGIADRVGRHMKANGYGSAHIEGGNESDWLVIDGGNFILHLFRPEVREFYALESMWR